MNVIYTNIKRDEKDRLVGDFSAKMDTAEMNIYRAAFRTRESILIKELKGLEGKTFVIAGYETIWDDESIKQKLFECRVAIIEYP